VVVPGVVLWPCQHGNQVTKLSQPLSALLDTMLEPNVDKRATLDQVMASEWVNMPLPPKLQVNQPASSMLSCGLFGLLILCIFCIIFNVYNRNMTPPAASDKPLANEGQAALVMDHTYA